jgi:biotin transport system substrate-specific component
MGRVFFHQPSEARERAIEPGAGGAEGLGRDDAAERAGTIALLRLTGVLAFPFLMGLTCQTQLWPWLAVPLPPFGVPLTLQTLWVLLAALSIGPRWGMLSMLGYLIVGAIGVPLFSEGSAGLATIFGQTGGYLVGFVACQPVIARIVRRPDGAVRGWGAMILAVLAGHAVIFAIGVPWLYLVRRLDGEAITLARALHGGFVVFIPAMLLKSGIAVLIGRWAAPWASRNIW